MSDTLLPLSTYALACAKRRASVAEAVRLCAGGQHAGFTTVDRAGAWFWACYRCPATREQGDPMWRTP